MSRVYSALIVAILAMALSRNSLAASVTGPCASQVIFSASAGLGDPLSTVLGPPNGSAPDLNNSGGVTLRFDLAVSEFDYQIGGTIPPGTDLIVTESTIFNRGGFSLNFGYVPQPVDANSDGVAENVTGQAFLLGTYLVIAPTWFPNYGSRLWFFDLDADPAQPFRGVTADFCVAIYDTVDDDSLDLDAVQVITTPICPGDVTADGTVNLDDLARLLAHFGVDSGAFFSDGDLDRDGDVDLSDLSSLLARFGTVCR